MYLFCQERRQLETVSRCICVCEHWPATFAKCNISCDSCHSTLDSKLFSCGFSLYIFFNIYIQSQMSSFENPSLQVGAAFLLVLLFMVLAIGVIHHWASNNFYLTRTQMFFVCFLAFLLALAAFLVGWFEGDYRI